MARLIIANTHRDVTDEHISKIQKGVETILNGHGAYAVGSGSGPGHISAQYEFPKKGAANLEINYIQEGASYDYFSSAVELIGDDSMWKAGSKLAKEIKTYFEKEQMNLYRDEITTAKGTAYVEGACVSDHMRGHRHSLIQE